MMTPITTADTQENFHTGTDTPDIKDEKTP
jgi:hypothetical protein